MRTSDTQGTEKIEMSKGSLLIVVGILLLTESQASGEVLVGIKGGVGISNFGLGANIQDRIRIYHDGNFDLNVAPFSRHGFQGGLFSNIPLNSFLSLQPEILYSEKGAGGDPYTNDQWKLNYLEAVVLVKCDLAHTGSNSFFIIGGVENDFKLSSKFTTENVNTGEEFVYEIGNVKSTDFGTVIGAGVSHQFNKIVLSLEGRYVFGMKSLVDTDIIYSDLQDTFYLANEDEPARNRSLKILVGLAFRI